LTPRSSPVDKKFGNFALKMLFPPIRLYQ
jgi:hypothetical protein